MSLKSSQWKQEEFFSPSTQNHQIIMSIRDWLKKVERKPILSFEFILCQIQFDIYATENASATTQIEVNVNQQREFQEEEKNANWFMKNSFLVDERRYIHCNKVNWKQHDEKRGKPQTTTTTIVVSDAVTSKGE